MFMTAAPMIADRFGQADSIAPEIGGKRHKSTLKKSFYVIQLSGLPATRTTLPSAQGKKPKCS
jgi:hypothetical protein